MTEAEADARAQELNQALGEAGDVGRFYVATEVRPGEWDAVEHRSRPWRVWLEKFLNSLPGSINP